MSSTAVALSIPTAMNIMAATAQNEVPTVKKSGSKEKTYSATSGIYERATSAKSCTAAKLSTYFDDKEGATADNIQMYIREDVDWMTVDYAANGNVTPKVTYTGDVDDQTDYVFTLECIDKNGASVKTSATFRITPRIYKPAISDVKVTIQTAEETSDTIAVADVFNYSKSKTGLTFTTAVTKISDNVLISSAVVNDEGNLIITVPQAMAGEAEVELTQTITHKTYGTKTFATAIPVTLEYEPVSGINGANTSDVNAYCNGNTLTVENANNACAKLYTVSGELVATFAVTSDNHSEEIDIAAGVYVLNVNNNSFKVMIK